MPPFPPLAALFLTHFDDIKGQSVVYYSSISADVKPVTDVLIVPATEKLPPQLIEHTTLPSGLHLVASDLIAFTHHGLPGIGLFRSRTITGEGAGRGRLMGTLGVVLATPSVAEKIFDLEHELGKLYDRLEASEVSPFTPALPSNTSAVLDDVWSKYSAPSLEEPETGISTQSVRALIQSHSKLSPSHPLTYLPALLGLLGPSLITVYKAAIAGKRVLCYSPPPLLPLAAFAWCIWAMSVPPSGAGENACVSSWIGNIGLMDLDEVKKRQGGWVATTSDAIYRSHPEIFDLFIDFSASIPPLADGADARAQATRTSVSVPNIIASRALPDVKPTVHAVTYGFADLGLYRSLVLLDSSPTDVNITNVGTRAMGRAGGLWLVLFEILEKAWNLCVGVCEYAVGRGRVGHIELEEGDEDARPLLLDDNGSVRDEDSISLDEGDENVELDEAVRRGRLILRQLHHNSYHLFARLVQVVHADGNAAHILTDNDVKQLTGASSFSLGRRGWAEATFWRDLAAAWKVGQGDNLGGL